MTVTYLSNEPLTGGYARLIPEGTPIELATLTLEQVALLLGRSIKSIKVDVTRKPESLPPIMRQPGSRKMLVRAVDMIAWMEGLSELERMRRRAVAEAARRDGVTVRPSRRNVLGNAHRNMVPGASMLQGKSPADALAEAMGKQS